MPHLYNDPVQPSTSVKTDGKNERAAAGGEEEEEEIEEVEPEIVQIDSEIHSELDFDNDEVDNSIALEYKQEELERNEEHNTAQIKIEPRGGPGGRRRRRSVRL